ncbi:tripartite tricarboxylate transporter substrate binding protein [Ramlibacter sp. USB13]|uniref:Tripartite tricarboxylate transporter substrate binding protein n=1 Tax=Ramlibacter cellulosilyticus TaxID=2764187 RepID=A0A923SCM5_9BURK|nr:tripartite tricarboxylate transporter substrate binding protein [Ramlibacter cellulosilyticus]MBC5784423.1 tripartite tricarboxylate transporter substrate binding protein [Ramlibacter cellulosilyticus]
MAFQLPRRTVLGGILLAPFAGAFAQAAWPARPVRVIVPSSPGGGTDAFGRILAQALTEQTGQSFVVDNKPGASGNIGADIAAKAEPDGYTILVASNSSLGINPVLLKTMPFDIERDLAPVTRGVMAPMVVVASPATGWKTLKDLVDAGKREPGKFFYGSAGVGSPVYVGVRMIEDATGARFTHVPYKGVAPAYQDLLSGRLQFMFTDLASIDQHIKAGKVVALAVNQKTPLLPNVPTLGDAGYPGVRAWTSFSVMAPAKVPPAIVKRLGEEVGKAMRNPAVVQRLEQQALIPVHDTPEEFAAELRKERQHWGEFIRRNNIQPE